MDDTAFHNALRESRNGTDNFHFNPLYRWMRYSDGVKEVAEAGCFWLIDALGLTIRPKLRAMNEHFVMATIHVSAKNSKAVITATTGDEDPPFFTEKVAYTDMPDCEWDMLLTFEDSQGFLVLVTEY